MKEVQKNTRVVFSYIYNMRVPKYFYSLSAIFFPSILMVYCGVVVIQAFTWNGALYKHTGVHPLFILLGLLSTGGLFYHGIVSKKLTKNKPGYKILVTWAKIFFPILFLLFISASLLSPLVSTWILKNLFFHWSRVKGALGYLTIIVLILLLIESYLNSQVELIKLTKKAIIINYFNHFHIVLKYLPFILMSFVLLAIHIFSELGKFNFVGVLVSLISTAVIYLVIKIVAEEVV